MAIDVVELNRVADENGFVGFNLALYHGRLLVDVCERFGRPRDAQYRRERKHDSHLYRLHSTPPDCLGIGLVLGEENGRPQSYEDGRPERPAALMFSV